MTNDELKAAAKRVQAELRELDSRFIGSGVSPTYVTTEFSTLDTLAEYAAAMLDDTPIDRAWLVKVLGEPDTGSNGHHSWLYDDSEIQIGDSCEASFGVWGDVVSRPETRADALAFFRLVRWEIEPGKIIQAFRETAAGGEGE